MTVYMVAQLKIHDPEGYDLYQSQFMEIFSRYKGTMLAADFKPEVLEGEWDKDRLVLMSFPDRDSFYAWVKSDEYQEILKHRVASAKGVFLLANGIEAPA